MCKSRGVARRPQSGFNPQPIRMSSVGSVATLPQRSGALAPFCSVGDRGTTSGRWRKSVSLHAFGGLAVSPPARGSLCLVELEAIRMPLASQCGRLACVNTLSHPTLGLLIDLSTEAPFRNEHLWTVMLRCGFLRDVGAGGDIASVLANSVMSTHAAAKAGDAQAHRNLLLFARLIAEKRTNHPPHISEREESELFEALLADGYELSWEGTTDYVKCCQLRPTDASPVPLAGEISALEWELGVRGYDVALNHYRQAVATYDAHNESANSQLRTTLEELVMRLAEDHTTYSRPVGKAGDGGCAIRTLRGHQRLADSDGGVLLDGLWKMTHTNGSHPGRSDARETRFRLHVITATALLLLHRFSAQP